MTQEVRQMLSMNLFDRNVSHYYAEGHMLSIFLISSLKLRGAQCNIMSEVALNLTLFQIF